MEKQTSYIGSNYSYTTFTQRANKTARNMVSVGTQTIKACIRVTISKSTLRNSINKMLKLQSKLNKIKSKNAKCKKYANDLQRGMILSKARYSSEIDIFKKKIEWLEILAAAQKLESGNNVP